MLIPSQSGDAAIEEVIGLEDYISYVNLAYASFDWFKPLDPPGIQNSLGSVSLGRYLERHFEEVLGGSFSKMLVATEIAGGLNSASPPLLERIASLISSLTAKL